MNDLIVKGFALFGAVIIVVLLSALLAYPYMLLWNAFLVKAIPSLNEVEWMQMWGITILAHGMFRSTGKI